MVIGNSAKLMQLKLC